MRDCGLYLVLVGLPACLCGCGDGGTNSPAKTGNAANTFAREAPAKGAGAAMEGRATEAPPAPGDGSAAFGRPPKEGASRDAGPPAAEKPGPSSAPSAPAPKADSADAMAGTDRSARKDRVQLPPGILTAGSFDDNLAPQFFQKFVGRFGQTPGFGDLPSRLLGQRLLLG